MRDVADGAAVIYPIAVAMNYAPAVFMVLTVPYLVYRVFYWREKYLIIKQERKNGKTHND